MVRAVDQATPGSNDAYFDAALFEKSLRLTKKSFAGAQNRMLKAVATPPSVAKLVILGTALMPAVRQKGGLRSFVGEVNVTSTQNSRSTASLARSWGRTDVVLPWRKIQLFWKVDVRMEIL